MTHPKKRAWLARKAACLAAAALVAPVPHTAGAAANGAAGPGGRGAKVVRSILELRDQQVVRQKWDLTCGASAIATVLTYQLGRPVSEREVAVAILRRTTPSLVRSRLGFSLLDLKVYAATQGLAAAAFDGMSLDDLDEMAPAIVPIRPHGFRHFVVYRGRIGDEVLIADPAFGNRTLSEAAFLKLWASGIGFVVFDPADPHPPNRMGGSPSLLLAPAASVQRAELFTARHVILPTGAGR